VARGHGHLGALLEKRLSRINHGTLGAIVREKFEYNTSRVTWVHCQGETFEYNAGLPR